MERHYVTTPFGRRSMTLAMVAGQLAEAVIPPGKRIDKWKVFRDLCDARPKLGLRDRALAVLNALLSFLPETQLEEGGNLVVFPSNAQLSVRANGIAGTTLRENLGLLVDCGLILRKDSPNGKRYARKDGEGAIREAYGFSLAPLLVRAEEFAALAQDVIAERRQIQLLRERITILRRDIRKLVAVAMEEGATDVDWFAIEAELTTALGGLSRKKSQEELEETADCLDGMHARALNMLANLAKTKKYVGNDGAFRAHIQNSKPNSTYESEPASEKSRAEIEPVNTSAAKPFASRSETDEPPTPVAASDFGPVSSSPPLKVMPLAAVTKACPEIRPYGPKGDIENWRELMAAAVVVRSMLGVSSSAYQDACEVMGPENAATVLACMLERAEHIQSPGGYLRSLTRRASRGEFSVGPMVMAAARSRGLAAGKTNAAPLPS